MTHIIHYSQFNIESVKANATDAECFYENDADSISVVLPLLHPYGKRWSDSYVINLFKKVFPKYQVTKVIYTENKHRIHIDGTLYEVHITRVDGKKISGHKYKIRNCVESYFKYYLKYIILDEIKCVAMQDGSNNFVTIYSSNVVLPRRVNIINLLDVEHFQDCNLAKIRKYFVKYIGYFNKKLKLINRHIKIEHEYEGSEVIMKLKFIN